MRVVWAIFCDYFTKDAQTGKDSIIGIFSQVNMPSFPSPPISMWLIVQLEFESDEADEQVEIRCDLIDEDGTTVHYVELRLGPPPVLIQKTLIRPTVPMFLPNVVFRSPGLHRMDLHCQGKLLCEVPLIVHQIPPPGA